MGDGYIDTDGTDLVYGLDDHSHIPMVDCYAISHLFVYIIAYKNKYRSFTLNLKDDVLRMVFLSILERNSKIALRDICANLPKYGIYNALYLTIETCYYFFDTSPTKIKHNTFIRRIDSSLI